MSTRAEVDMIADPWHVRSARALAVLFFILTFWDARNAPEGNGYIAGMMVVCIYYGWPGKRSLLVVNVHDHRGEAGR